MTKLSKVEQAISTLRAAVQKKTLSEGQLSEIESLAELAKGTRPAVEGIIFEKNDKKPTGILAVLEKRLEQVPEHFRRPEEGIDFAEVKSALDANPALKASLLKMEETGGAPDIIAVEGDTFIFADCSEESPGGRRNLNYDQAVSQALEFGAELMDEATYRKIQKIGKFDYNNSYSWLKTPADIRKTGHALVGDHFDHEVSVRQHDALEQEATCGWRGVLRVPKVKNQK